jgi:hypothetical protein
MSSPYLYGAVALLVLWLVSGLLTRTWNPVHLALGEDGRISTSKFQWLLWTAVIFFSYTVLYAARASAGGFDPIAEIPENVLVVMAISTATMAGAKGVTSVKVGKGRRKPPAVAKTANLTQVINDDSGFPDLSKIQMMAWTLLVATIYLVQVVHAVPDGADIGELPDIDRTLMVLMGFGSGGYLATKVFAEPAAQPIAVDAQRPEA